MKNLLIILTILLLTLWGCGSDGESFDCASCQSWEHCVNQSSCHLIDGSCNSDADCVERLDGKTKCGGENNHTCISTDPCNGITCQENATCQSGDCICDEGFEASGDQCVAKDPCNGITCQTNATCQDGSCICDEGFEVSGDQCVAIDPCKNITCQTNATCQSGNCVCDAGFHPEGDQCKADQANITPGDLIITEFMADPTSVSDSDGEWIEIHNTTAHAISLTGISIVKDNSATWSIPGDSHTIAANGYFTLARSAKATLPQIDLVLEDISLTNSGTHKLAIKEGSTIINEISYTYLFTMKGRALQQDQNGNWCHSIDIISGENSDLGTPGKENIPCGTELCDQIYCHSFEYCSVGFCMLQSEKCYTQSDCESPLYCGGDDNHSCISDQLPLTPISELQTNQVMVGTKVRTTGYITAKNSDSIWIQDKDAIDAGLMLFNVGSYTSTLSTGDQIEVEGIYKKYYSLSELDEITSLVKLDTTPYTPAPVELAVANISDVDQIQVYESMVATFNEQLVVGKNENSEITVTDQLNNVMVIRGTLMNLNLPEGVKLKQISGLLDRHNDQFQLLPRSTADIVEDQVTCATLTCDENMVCSDAEGDATCICDNENGYFDNNGTCVNPCAAAVNPCSETNKTICTPTGPGETDVTCDCDPGYLPSGDQCISDQNCFTFSAMAANISTGKDQSYTNGEGIRIFQALKPDVVMIQEFNYKSDSPSDIREFIDIAFGTEFHYSRGQATHNIPNGVISRWPILDSGYWDDPYIPDRDLDWAIVDIPGTRDLFVISVHLHTSPSSDQVGAASIIADEIAAIKTANPNRYYFMVGGDFNGPSAVTDPNGFGKHNDFATNEPYPVGEDGEVTTNSTGSKHLDFVVSGSELVHYRKPVVITNPENSSDQKIYTNGFVFDSRDFTQEQLDTYFSPVQTTDSCAKIDGVCYMQHMAVTKFYSSCE